jgi:DNA repair photolyase
MMKRTKAIQFTVEKGRVLVPVGEPCPFGCRYCYTRTGEVGPARADPTAILQKFQEFAQTHSFDYIQLGYDGEPFARPERGLMMLQQLAIMGKPVSFSTKALIDGQILEALADIQKAMLRTQTTLIGFVSLSCWDSASSIEPYTPTPAERITTLANLKSIEIPTFVAVRPILPHLPLQEYDAITSKALEAGCDGFILGPLYSDDNGRFVRFIPNDILRETPYQKIVVAWSAHAPMWRRYENKNRLQRIADIVEAKGGRVFLSSVDALQFISQKGVRV